MNIWAAGRAGFPSGDAGFAFTNHSGLSTVSRVSPERMVAFLRAVAGAPLPLGSEPGDPRLPTGVARILRPYNVAAKSVKLDYDRLTVAAKTGTMDYVRGLAGYIVTPRDRRIAFAVFSNHLGRRDGDGRGIDRGWMARARGFERALIRNWVLKADA
jgi:D-alanyl-D-alanine carboxypeptidase/D-alanyl-D-alanine-endopeptidase (penicillin-binding protein 4)